MESSPSYRKPTPEEVQRIVTRMRHRGTVNPMFDDVAKAFEKENPGLKCIWEHAPPDSKDQFDVQTREMFGYRVVMAEEIPAGVPTPHTQASGPVRVADMILMCVPVEIHDAYYAEITREAQEQANLPATEYQEALKMKASVGKHQGTSYGGVQTRREGATVDLDRIAEEK